MSDKGVKKLDADSLSVEMYKKHIKGDKIKDIAAEYGFKSTQPVSKRIKKIQKLVAQLEDGVQKGDIVVRPAGTTKLMRRAQGTGIELPRDNPFLALDKFSDIAQVTTAAGSVEGLAVSMIHEGFTNDNLPYGQKLELAMKGGSVVIGSLLAAYETFKKYTAVPNSDVEIVDDLDEGDE